MLLGRNVVTVYSDPVHQISIFGEKGCMASSEWEG